MQSALLQNYETFVVDSYNKYEEIWKYEKDPHKKYFYYFEWLANTDRMLVQMNKPNDCANNLLRVLKSFVFVVVTWLVTTVCD